jgi:hypothetical protein
MLAEFLKVSLLSIAPFIHQDAGIPTAPISANEPNEIQEVIDEARARCRGLRGAFSMPTGAVRSDIDLNSDGVNDYLIDNNIFECDRGTSRSYRASRGFSPDNKVTAIISENGGFTTHEFLALDYRIVSFDDEALLILREPEDSCNSRQVLRPLNRDGSKLVGPGCYRALVWRDGIFASAR